MDNNIKISETIQKYYDKVFSDGKLVNVHIGMWGMSHNLTKEDIKIDNVLPDEIKLGKKMLIKTAVYNKFKNLEQKIRNFLYKNSFEFPLVSQAHFVPKTKYLDVYNKLTELRVEYLQMAQEFFDKYEDYKTEAIEYYKEHKDTVNVDLEKHYPSLEEVKKKFYMDIASFEICLPTNFANVDIHTEIAREGAKQEAQNEYSIEYNRQMELHMEKINIFTQEVVSTLRNKIAAHCTVALNKINNKEIITDASIRTLMRHIQEFREMNFLEDKSIEEELKKVEGLLDSGRDFSKDTDAIGLLQQKLTTIVNEAKSVSDFANVSGEYFRKLAI